MDSISESSIVAQPPYRSATADIDNLETRLKTLKISPNSKAHPLGRSEAHPTKARHLDRSRAASSRGAVERPLYFAFAVAFAFACCRCSCR